MSLSVTLGRVLVSGQTLTALFQDTNLYFQDTNWIFKYLDCENCLTEMYFSSIKRFGFPESPKLPQLCPSDGEAQKNLILWDDVEC